MKKLLFLAYAAACYAAFFATLLYLVGFLANAVVPRSIDVGPSASTAVALAIDVALLALFGVQHSGMARGAFKRRLTRFVPEPIERATYVLATSAVLVLLYAFWRPLPAEVWDLSGTILGGVLWGVFALGWVLVLVSTFIIDHFHLFGLKQVVDHARGAALEEPRFRVSFLYRVVRHPIYLGWLIAFWATPAMTAGHLLFAGAMTTYILIAIQLEERDLVRFHGARYEEYQWSVPMLLPNGRTWASADRRGEGEGASA